MEWTDTQPEKSSFLNKDAVRGGLMGGMLGIAVGVIIEEVIEKMLDISADTFGFGPVAAVVITALAAAVIGGYISTKSGEKRRERQLLEEHGQAQVLQYNSPERAPAPEYAMETGKDWGTKMLEERFGLTPGQGL